MNKYEIVRRIEKFAPAETAEPWDCVGFMVETSKIEINKLMLCLTPTENVIKQAKAQNCDMIVSHHPLLEIKFHSELVSESLSPSIDIYSAHTNMDLSQGGTTDTLIKNLGYKSQGEGFVRYVQLDAPITVHNLADNLRKISPNLRYVNNFDIKTVQKIGFCAGSGSEFINTAQENGADCFVTGDLKFHTALDSEIPVFDIGHFESEIMIQNVFKEIIGSGVEIIFASEKSPFIY